MAAAAYRAIQRPRRDGLRRCPWDLGVPSVAGKIANRSNVGLAQISLDRGTEVTVTVGRDLPAAADGETLPCAAPLHPGTPLRIRALPRALRVLVPGGLSRRASPRPALPPG
jgi:hypothetical protein